MPIRPTIDSSSLRILSKALGDIDPALRRQVGKDIKNALRPTAAKIRHQTAFPHAESAIKTNPAKTGLPGIACSLSTASPPSGVSNNG